MNIKRNMSGHTLNLIPRACRVRDVVAVNDIKNNVVVLNLEELQGIEERKWENIRTMLHIGRKTNKALAIELVIKTERNIRRVFQRMPKTHGHSS